MTDITKDTINAILEDYNKFTKEELEIIEAFKAKKRAKHDIAIYEQLENTEPAYFQRNVLFSKYKEIAIEHKKLVIDTTLKHIELHRDILLQCLNILNNLVSNPNLLDTLLNLLNSEWYGNMDFKQFICQIIDNELNNINNLYAQLRILNTQPLICFIPEIYLSQNETIDTTTIADFYNTTNSKYYIEP